MKPVVCCANCEYVFPECGAKNMGCDKFSPNWRNRPAPDKTGFEVIHIKLLLKRAIELLNSAEFVCNAALSQKEGERCPDMKNCNKGDVLSPYKPHEILAECTKYPKQCKGGAKQ